MHPQDGLCIETSYIADSIHKEENPKVLLKAGQVFEEETTYTFEVRKWKQQKLKNKSYPVNMMH